MWSPVFLLWPLAWIGNSGGISWYISVAVFSFWAGVLLYPACLIYLGVVLFALDNSGGYTGSQPALIFALYFVFAVGDFAISYLYTR